MQKINTPDWYCANLHTSLMISLDDNGSLCISPCTKYPAKYTIDSDQIFNHSEIQLVRKINKDYRVLPDECDGCHPRNFQTCENRSWSNSEFIDNELLYDQSGPRFISFLVSYVCNLACTTCGPGPSSKWRALTSDTKRASSVDPEKLRAIIKNIDLSNLEIVHIYGGEPFADPVNNVILEELAPYGKNISIWYDTNGTFIPSQQTMSLWENFHLIRAKFSVDGIGESFDYLRWPGKWADVEKNIIAFKQNCPNNVMFTFRPAIGFLNLPVFKDIRNWFNENLLTNRLGDLSSFEYNGVYGIFSGQHITERMYNDLINTYTPDDPVMRIINSRRQFSNNEIIHKIQQELNRIDSIRKTDYKKSLSYLNKYF